MFISYLVSVLYFPALSTQISNICKEDLGHESCNLLPGDSRCGYPDAYKDTSRIMGGHNAELSSYPWIACLQRDGADKCFCGGSLISQDYVLTAAHCVYNKTRPFGFSVVLGEHDLRTDPDCSKTTGECSPPVQRLDVETIFVHEDFHEYPHDIALLKLLTPAKKNRHVLPICLPFRKFDNTDNMRVINAGWGKIIEDGTSSIRYVLQESEFMTVPEDECKKSIYEDDDEHICIAVNLTPPVHRTTPGDSGGPLMTYKIFDEQSKRFYLLGVNSYMNTRTSKSVFTRVASYIPWILDHMSSVN